MMRVYFDYHVSGGDLGQFVALGVQFAEESGLDITPDPDRIYEYITAMSDDPDFFMHVLVDDYTGELGGFSIASVSRIFSVEPLGATEFFFILPAHRNYMNARRLMGSTTRSLQAMGCKYIFSNTISDISSRVTKGFSAILERTGYKRHGDCYVLKEEET